MSKNPQTGGNKRRKQKVGTEQGSHQPFAQLPPPAETIDHKLLLQTALQRTLDTGVFYDTKFYVFSRRKAGRVVYAPKAVYANGWLLRYRLPSYFEQLLSDTFGDCVIGELDGGYPATHKASIDDYEYDSDSDLEDDEDDGDSTEGSFVQLFSSALRAPETNENPKVDDQASPGTSGSQSTEEVPSDPTESTLEESKTGILSTPLIDRKGMGRIVVLQHIAYTTWKALLFYLSTGEVSFKRLRSQGTLAPAPTQVQKSSAPPPCSPKSMYRIAHRLGLDDLKNKAKDDILSKLSVDNMLDELFSSTTATYDEIRDAQIDFACKDASQRKEIAARMPKWIEAFAAGELRNCSDCLLCLIQKMADPSNDTGSTPVPSRCQNCNRNGVSWRCNYCNYNLQSY